MIVSNAYLELLVGIFILLVGAYLIYLSSRIDALELGAEYTRTLLSKGWALEHIEEKIKSLDPGDIFTVGMRDELERYRQRLIAREKSGLMLF